MDHLQTTFSTQDFTVALNSGGDQRQRIEFKTLTRETNCMRTLQSLVLVTGFGALVAGCSEPPVDKGPVVRPVKIHTIGSLEPAALREFPGTIRAYQTAEMGFEGPGRVTEFLVREGVEVQKDQVLARLDPRDYEADLKAAQANLDKTQSDLERNLAINKRAPNSIPQEDIEGNQRAVDVSKAQWEIAKKALDDTELKTPFAGIMARKLVEDFANVQAKESVLIVQDNSILEIEIAVPERDFVRRQDQEETTEDATARIKPVVIVSALPDREFAARIKEFATTADPVTRTFSVKLNFDKPEDVNVLPGMTARARVVIDPESAWSVPATAAQADENGQAYVWKVDSGGMTVSRSAVEVGPLTGDRVFLKSGVEEGDMVAISGVISLREGMKVRKYEN